MSTISFVCAILSSIRVNVIRFFSRTARAADALDTSQMTNGFTQLSNWLIAGLAGVGGIFIAIGVISLATAIKSGEQNPESLTSAGKNIMIGVLFCSVGVLIALFK